MIEIAAQPFRTPVCSHPTLD